MRNVKREEEFHQKWFERMIVDKLNSPPSEDLSYKQFLKNYKRPNKNPRTILKIDYSRSESTLDIFLVLGPTQNPTSYHENQWFVVVIRSYIFRVHLIQPWCKWIEILMVLEMQV